MIAYLIIITILYVAANIILLGSISYKEHCIDDLENRTETLIHLKDNEKLHLLNQIKEMTNTRKSFTMLDVRDFADKEIAKIKRTRRQDTDI